MSSTQNPSNLVWDKTCFNCDLGAHSSKEPRCVKCFKEDKPGNRWPDWRVYDRTEVR